MTPVVEVQSFNHSTSREIPWLVFKVKVAQSCWTLWDPMDYTVNGILQARILESVAHSLLQGIFPTQVSSIARRFFISWATREAQISV